MSHIVVRPFMWCPDDTGITIEVLNVGDERDFGKITESLMAEGYIKQAPAKPGRKKKVEDNG